MPSPMSPDIYFESFVGVTMLHLGLADDVPVSVSKVAHLDGGLSSMGK